MRHAEAHYDLGRLAEAEEIGRRLIDDPFNRCEVAQLHDPLFQAKIQKRLADNPAVLTKQLQLTAQGVNWLIQRWLELAEMLRRNKFWHYPEKFRALWMLGKNPHDVYEDKVVQKIFLACNVAHPEVSDGDNEMLNLWDECYQAKMGIPGKPMYVLQLDNIRGLRPADALTAQAQLWEIITAEMNRLGELKKNHLDEINRLDRASAQETRHVRRQQGGRVAPSLRDGVRARVPQGDRGPHEAPQGGRFEGRDGGRGGPIAERSHFRKY